MNVIYCQKCFKKTPQTVDIPKFCSHCGKPFIEASASTITNIDFQSSSNKQSPQLQSKRSELRRRADIEGDLDNFDDLETEIDDENDEVSVPNINKLDVEVDIPKETAAPLRSVARNTPRQPRTKTSTNPKTKKIDKKKFLAEFQKQASAIKPK